MNDFASDIAAPEAPSTVIDMETPTNASGGGAPQVVEDVKQPSLRDTIADEVRKESEARAKPDDGKEDKPDDAKPADDEGKAKVEEKAGSDRAPDGKFAPKPKDDGAERKSDTKTVGEAQDKSEQGKHYTDPPKNFLPDAKEMWRNVPRPVRRDLDQMVRDHEAFREQARITTERYESIRPFDELAQSNGRDLRESLARINQVETALQRDPIYGLNEILKEIGPRKPDGSAVSIFEVAQYITERGPQAIQQQMHAARQAEPAPVDPRLTETEQQLQEARFQLIQMQVIEPFKAEHPRYDELQEPIARILKSDMVSPSLSVPERLEAAYVMAERLNPPSSPTAEPEAPAPERRAADSLNGSKSIRSAPGAVSPDMEPERGGSIRELLQDELRRQKRS